MNKALFLFNLKSNWGILLFVALVLMIYIGTSVTMYDPENVDVMEQMFKLLPEGMLKAFGFDNLGTDLTGYLGHYLYGFIAIVFPLIYLVVAANKLVAKHVDSGSMAYLLTTPATRINVAVTQAVFLVFGLVLIFVVDIGILIALSASMYPGLLDVGRFLVLNFVTVMSLAAVGGISFFFSCFFNEARFSLAIGGGIPIAFFVLKMVSEIDAKLENLKYLSLFSVVKIDKILEDPTYGVGIGLILFGVALALYASATIVFNKKSLTI
jgi:ABC-2 type transport system permease protein